jgi:hypothetical protein
MLKLYKIKKKISNVNYKLELLNGSKIYLIFYILLLKEAARTIKTSTKEIRLKHKLNVYNVKNQTESLHLETAVAYSRNWLPSPRSRPSLSLLKQTLSEQARVLTLCINPSLFSLRLLPPLLLPTPTLLAILGLASACIRARRPWSP